MSEQAAASPFHEGERELQTRVGVRDQLEDMGQRFIRGYLPDEHREFYEQLPYLIIGSIDPAGNPWASILVGRTGFISTPDANTLSLNTPRIYGDPLNAKDRLFRKHSPEEQAQCLVYFHKVDRLPVGQFDLTLRNA